MLNEYNFHNTDKYIKDTVTYSNLHFEISGMITDDLDVTKEINNNILYSNYKKLENIIKGFVTLDITGYKTVNKTLETKDNNIIDGTKIITTRYLPREIEVSFAIVDSTSNELNKLQRYLSKRELHFKVKDGDKSYDSFYIKGVVTEFTDIEHLSSNLILGKFKIFCADPFYYTDGYLFEIGYMDIDNAERAFPVVGNNTKYPQYKDIDIFSTEILSLNIILKRNIPLLKELNNITVFTTDIRNNIFVSNGVLLLNQGEGIGNVSQITFNKNEFKFSENKNIITLDFIEKDVKAENGENTLSILRNDSDFEEIVFGKFTSFAINKSIASELGDIATEVDRYIVKYKLKRL